MEKAIAIFIAVERQDQIKAQRESGSYAERLELGF
jgi:hypothetical protein